MIASAHADMIQLLLTSLILSFCAALLFASTPIILGLTCLIIAFVTAALLASLFSSWFALIALLIYVGGLLVIFAYFLAICPNQLIAIKTPAATFSISFILLTLTGTPQNTTLVNPTPLSNIFFPINVSLLLLLALLLLLTMISVVKITQRNRGPLRPF